MADGSDQEEEMRIFVLIGLQKIFLGFRYILLSIKKTEKNYLFSKKGGLLFCF